MARPSRCRRICEEPVYDRFIPEGESGGGSNILTLDEYETIRLIDLEKFTHEQCARQMEVSRTTVTEIYESAREKIADSIVHGKALLITGGHYRVCDGSAICHWRKSCRKAANRETIGRATMGRATENPVWSRAVREKGAKEMRIAVTYEDGMVFQHFGHTEQFKLYDVEEKQMVSQQVIDTNGSGHGALAGLLAGLGVDVLICGGIGGGARAALSEQGIKLYGGAAGAADDVVKAFLEGHLDYNPDVQCSHHGEGHHGHGHHGEGHGNCGEHHGGCGDHHGGCGEYHGSCGGHHGHCGE